jgi:uncharacterized protein
MELINEFTVNVPIDEAWKILTDVELIAPCMPGAQLQEIEGETYRGIVKIKVGPITAQFKGQATFVEKDDDAHKAVLKAEGRDTGGKGNASAMITAQLAAASETSTVCTVTTDLTITGKVAQFGRGALADVSTKLLGQFVDCLETDLLTKKPEPVAAAAEPVAEAAAAPTAALRRHRCGARGCSRSPTVRKINAPEAKPVDVLGVAPVPPMVKKLLPAGLIVLILLLLIRRRRPAGD